VSSKSTWGRARTEQSKEKQNRTEQSKTKQNNHGGGDINGDDDGQTTTNECNVPFLVHALACSCSLVTAQHGALHLLSATGARLGS
jgi:hypothetical protein